MVKVRGLEDEAPSKAHGVKVIRNLGPFGSEPVQSSGYSTIDNATLYGRNNLNERHRDRGGTDALQEISHCSFKNTYLLSS